CAAAGRSMFDFW
nr:immunoglobulin heavy chain junction region [Macaca mulatta]